MEQEPTPSGSRPTPPGAAAKLRRFRSDRVARVRRDRGVWTLPRGEIRLPRVFGFCRGVTLALASLLEALDAHQLDGKRLVLLGEIIHNPWVNAYFRRMGVRILTREERDDIEKHIGPADCAVIPAFGVPLPIERRLRALGCSIVDASCGDVRRLWAWAERAAKDGCGVLIFGRSRHDETVVTKSRLADVGGRYLVAGDLDEVDRFCAMLAAGDPQLPVGRLLGPDATNAETLEAFFKLATVSQTTMLFDETQEVRRRVTEAFTLRFPSRGEDDLLLQPAVCRATQDRQTAAMELCRSGLDIAIVIGGVGSSNSRHLYELARRFAPSYFIEDASALVGPGRLRHYDFARGAWRTVEDWLGDKGYVRIGVLAGASSPEAVVGEVLQRLAEFLEGPARPVRPT